ncbi:hypothetical protein RBSH_04731 [Rhodopirellula baltica SH28]|uniref:Uncharacterized protein n=1 Tax=Rhodopirellula baltica SH28 TaxID=993517 RepID=K5DC34_RHOBT|nr:hypothetical protein RBSH_04731 [Rhodopirellula baltica SH28]
MKTMQLDGDVSRHATWAEIFASGEVWRLCHSCQGRIAGEMHSCGILGCLSTLPMSQMRRQILVSRVASE